MFTTVESVAFVSFLYVQIQSKSVKKVLFVLGLGLLAFNVFYPFFSSGVNQIDSVPIGVETIIVMIFSFYYLYERTNDTTTLYIYSTFPFWVVIGMVLYLSGSFFIYLFADSLTKLELHKYWIITNVLSIMKNIFFAIGIIVNSKPPKSFPPSDFILSSSN